MKSNEARELLIARVQAAHEKWPKFHDMPEVTSGDSFTPIDAEALKGGDPSKPYVAALYAAAYQGEPVGRNGFAITVRKVAEPKEPVARQRTMRTSP